MSEKRGSNNRDSVKIIVYSLMVHWLLWQHLVLFNAVLDSIIILRRRLNRFINRAYNA